MDESTLVKLAIEECVKIAQNEADRCKEWATTSETKTQRQSWTIATTTARIIRDRIKALLTKAPNET